MVGEASSLSDLSDYEEWKAEECPTAHNLVGTLSEYSAVAVAADDDWLDAPALVWTSISVAHGDPTETAETSVKSEADGIWTLYDHLKTFTSAEVALEEDSANCTVSKIRYHATNTHTLSRCKMWLVVGGEWWQV